MLANITGNRPSAAVPISGPRAFSAVGIPTSGPAPQDPTPNSPHNLERLPKAMAAICSDCRSCFVKCYMSYMSRSCGSRWRSPSTTLAAHQLRAS